MDEDFEAAPGEAREKKADQGLTQGGESGIIGIGSDGALEQAKTRDKKIEITDIAIEKAEAPGIPYFTTEQNQKFKELNKELLRDRVTLRRRDFYG